VTHIAGFVEKIFTFIGHGTSDDNHLSLFQLFAEATKKYGKSKRFGKPSVNTLSLRYFHTPEVTRRKYSKIHVGEIYR